MAPIQNTEFIHKTSYLQLPRSIWNSELSLEAVCLYTYLLDLSKLSEKNGNIDEKGIYVFCTLETAAEQLRCERKKALRAFKELIGEELLHKVYRGRNTSNLYYISAPPQEMVPVITEEPPAVPVTAPAPVPKPVLAEVPTTTVNLGDDLLRQAAAFLWK